MKRVFVYYSLTGNGDYVAEVLGGRGTEIRKIDIEKKLPDGKFSKILQGGFRALVGYREKLIYDDFNPEEYDEIIIGSPIWNGRLSSPVNTLLKEKDLTGKKVTFILYSGSGKGKVAEQKIRGKYPSAITLILREPKSNAESCQDILNSI